MAADVAGVVVADDSDRRDDERIALNERRWRIIGRRREARPTKAPEVEPGIVVADDNDRRDDESGRTALYEHRWPKTQSAPGGAARQGTRG